MEFRTKIDMRPVKNFQISHSDRIVMLGSCFTDNVGALLERDGFRVTRNPLGPLYNPASLCRTIDRALHGVQVDRGELVRDDQGVYHCLDFASRYSSTDIDDLWQTVNEDIDFLSERLHEATTVIITLGSAYVYYWLPTHAIVGNCHKFPSQCFERKRLSANVVAHYLYGMVQLLEHASKRVIFTVSPIRHLGDGLHGNQLSKATLLTALDELNPDAFSYFPSYEIMMDDLRDYRFYAADMKHPSDVAVEYIYEQFANAYFSQETKDQALAYRKEWLRKAHRPILK